jgi:hypothetical protein
MKSQSFAISKPFNRLQMFILAFFLLIFFSCKKDGTSNQQNSKDYYFEATLSDGRIFKVTDSYPPSLNSTAVLEGIVDVGITAEASTNDECRLPGDCFAWNCGIIAQKEGTYDPFLFIISTKEGADQYVYIANEIVWGTPQRDNLVKVTISKIERGTPAGPGSLEGAFSGTVFKQKYPFPNPEKPLQISGKFRLPLKK